MSLYKSKLYGAEGTSVSLNGSTGVNVGTDVSKTIETQTGTCSAINVGNRWKITNNSVGVNYVGGAHDVTGLFHYEYGGNGHSLIIVGENKYDGSGDVETLILGENQIASNSSDIATVYTGNSSINNNSGEIENVILNNLSINNNDGDIQSIIGLLLADWSKGGGTIETVIGIQHGPSPSNDATYIIINNTDRDASIQHAGRFIGSAGREIGSVHPGIATGRYYFPRIVGTPFGSAAFPANFIYGSVFVCPERTTFNRIGVKFGNAVVGATVKYYVYAMAAGVPTTLVAESAEVDASAGGDIEAVISATLEAGCYFVACNTSDDTSEILFTTPQLDLLGESDTDGIDNQTVYGMASNTADAAPSSFAPLATETSITPYIWLRKL